MEKVHAAVARSKFGSQESRVSQHVSLGALLEAEMSKKCPPLWREAHLEVNMSKTLRFGPLFDDSMRFVVKKVHTAVAHEAHVQVRSVKNSGF